MANLCSRKGGLWSQWDGTGFLSGQLKWNSGNTECQQGYRVTETQKLWVRVWNETTFQPLAVFTKLYYIYPLTPKILLLGDYLIQIKIYTSLYKNVSSSFTRNNPKVKIFQVLQWGNEFSRIP